jgi:kynurenine 3-monooxygenase
MVTVKCAPWHDEGRTLLIGDAAHAIVPFFGQGMNCGFEDCAALDELIGRHQSWAAAFEAFAAERKTNADAIADMAVENFTEMRDKVGDARFLLEKAVEKVLEKKFPGRYVSRYTLVSFSRTPYRKAYEVGLIQAGMLDELCKGLHDAKDVDLTLADRLIRDRLS